jgi:photosystem II stability/assembly factor-like uncharacterized protein
MKPLKNIYSVLFITIFLSVPLFPQWIQTNGPFGNGTIRTLAVSGNNLFGGSYELGVFLSTNNGDSWSQTSMTNKAVQSLYAFGTYIFAGTTDGAYLTTDNGQNWSQISSIPMLTFTSIGTTIYAGTSSGVYSSVDNGSSWVSAGLQSSIVNVLYTKGNDLIAGLLQTYPTGPGIYISTDQGTNWTSMGLDKLNIYAINSLGSRIFALAYQGNEAGSFYVTTDTGANWTSSSIEYRSFKSLAVFGDTLFVGTDNLTLTFGNQIYRSLDYGATWTDISKGLSYYSAVQAIAIKGNSIFAATEIPSGSTSDVYRSTNNGNSWQVVNNGMFYKYILSFASVGTDIFAGTYAGGIYYSADNGNNWFAVNTGLPNGAVWSLAASGNVLLAGVGFDNNGISRSTDHGSSWSSSGLTACTVEKIALQNNMIYAATTTASSGGGVYVSADTGLSWTLLGLQYKDIISLAVSGNSIFAGTADSGVYRSTDNGASWATANNGITNLDITSLIPYGGKIIAGTFGGGVFITTDNGNNWTAANVGFPSDYCYVNTIISANSTIIAGLITSTSSAKDVVYISTDGGANWINKSDGLDPVLASTQSLFTVNNYVFMGSHIVNGQGDFGKSVWRRSLSELTKVEEYAGQKAEQYSLQQNYPNPFNPSTTITYSLKERTRVSIIVYDILGNAVKTLVNEEKPAGHYEAGFNAANLSSGVYFYTLRAGTFSETKKLMFIK